MSRYLPPIQNPNAAGGTPPSDVTDHFAPTIIVGNVLSGDPAVAQVAPFRYIGDPGDGTGIETAFSEVVAPGAWVHIRRGTYTLDAGVLPLTVPDGCRVTGDGVATILVGRATDRRVFILGSGSDVSLLRINVVAATAGASGAHVVDASGAQARFTDVFMQGPGDGLNVDETLFSFVRLGAGLAQAVRVADAPRTPNATVACVRVRGGSVGPQVLECDLDGGDYQVFAESGPAPTSVRIVDNRCVGAGSAASTANISVGSGALLDLVHGNLCVGGAIGISYDGVGGHVTNNVVSDADTTAIVLGVNSVDVICGFNSLGGGVISDLGVGNEVAHNV